jgi:hypothetical protein
MEAALSSETLVSNQHSTQRYNPENNSLYLHRRDNPKSRIKAFLINIYDYFTYKTILQSTLFTGFDFYSHFLIDSNFAHNRAIIRGYIQKFPD